jgi:hypothetical protein
MSLHSEHPVQFHSLNKVKVMPIKEVHFSIALTFETSRKISLDNHLHLLQPLFCSITREPYCGFFFVYSLKEPDVDRHPEKRLKAAFAAFEEANMPRIKSENPTLRLSQLKQILRKEWMRSPENPLNQRTAS